MSTDARSHLSEFGILNVGTGISIKIHRCPPAWLSNWLSRTDFDRGGFVRRREYWQTRRIFLIR